MSSVFTDKLGVYQVTSWIDKAETKPASIEYSVRCVNCKETWLINGSLTTRSKTLNPNCLLLCPCCGWNIFRKPDLDKLEKYLKSGKKLPKNMKLKYVELKGEEGGNINEMLEV